jgi:uncharacterized protein YdhG (YjbR/CyaY superfamily)
MTNMSVKKTTPKDIDEYIAGFAPEVRAILENIRAITKREAPEAQEAIKYGMPTFTLEGNLVHFAAFKKHIGFFPPVNGDEAFKKAASVYEGEKGSLRFPLDEAIPYELIARAVKFRVSEILKKPHSRKN